LNWSQLPPTHKQLELGESSDSWCTRHKCT